MLIYSSVPLRTGMTREKQQDFSTVEPEHLVKASQNIRQLLCKACTRANLCAVYYFAPGLPDSGNVKTTMHSSGPLDFITPRHLDNLELGPRVLFLPGDNGKTFR